MYLLYIIIYYSVNTLIILNITRREMFEVDIYVCEMLVYTG